jgi:TonB-linked SusC/RagA family outer membrane protein
MDFIRHFVPLREAQPKALSFNAPQATKTIESATGLFIRTMRLTGVILLAFCLQVSARSDAQQRIAINVKNASLQKLFAEIEKKTNYTFFYDVSILKETKPVTVTMKDATVEEILRMAMVGQSLEYTITDKTIFVKKERKAVVEATAVDTGKGGGIKVRGVVLTEVGVVPVQGANVTVKQTEKGTITNAKGEFELSYAIPVGSVLIFSYVGYAPQNFTVKDGSPIRIYMKVAQDELDKAVVQAYGTTTQRLTTADIGKVTAEEIERQPVMNPLLALQGRVAGLDVVQTSGYASAPIKVELRGRPDINPLFTADPLYIIDGVPLTVNQVSGNGTENYYATGSPGFAQAMPGPAGGQSPFFSINPSDIESIEVLKDADATAIYGSRGANGVIIVTTKKGKAGRTKLDLNIQEGINRVDRFWDMMNTTQYLAMRRQAFFNTGTSPDPVFDYDVNGTWDTTRNTNWQKVIYGGMGKNINVQSSLSGGDARTTFRVGAGYNRAIGITTVSGSDQRASVSLNLTHRSLDQRLSVSSSNGFSYTESDMINLAGNVLMAPDAPAIYDSLGNLNWAGWGGINQNAKAEAQYPFGGLKQPYIGKTDFLNSNLVISYELIKGLQVSSSLGYNVAEGNQIAINPIAAQNPLYSPTGRINLGYNHNVNWIFEPQVTYNIQAGNGKLSILIGGSLSQNNTESFGAGGSGYTSDLLIHNISSAPNFIANDQYGEYKYFGVFTRATYNWGNKYVLSLSARRDGSSRFGPGKQFGDFGSVGAAWIASEEGWLKKILPQAVSFIKLRGSYGTTGSDAVPDYSYLSQYVSYLTLPYTGQSTLATLINPNPNFRWQSNKKLEGAMNLGFLKDRINIQIVWYRDRCGNQLVAFPTPAFTGFTSVIENSPALVQNLGWEFTASANLINSKRFSWTLNFNTAFNRNKLVAYPNFSQSPYINLLKVGQPLNMQYAFHYTGVDPQTGQYTFLDKNHDGVINQSYPAGMPYDDRFVVVTAPKFFGGLGMNLNFSGLSVNLFFNIKEQIGQNAFLNIGQPGFVNNNAPVYILGKQWQHQYDNASIAKFTNTGLTSYSNFQQSDGVYTDASYVRLSNVSISYSVPAKHLGIAGLHGCSIFFHTNNLFILTKYKGLDPETQNFGGLPPTKTIVGGISLSF